MVAGTMVHRRDNAQQFAQDRIVVASQTAFDFSSAEYQALYEASNASAFQHPIWLSEFYSKLAQAREAQPLIIVGRYRNGNALAFVLPLIERRLNFIRLIETADLGVSDYAAPIIAPCLKQAFSPSETLAPLINQTIGRYDVVRIKPIIEHAREDWQVFFDLPFETLDFSAHASHMSAPYDNWRSDAFGRSQEKYLDRKIRKLSGQGDVKLRCISDKDELDHAIAFMVEQRRGRFEGDPIQTGCVEEFYRAVAQRGLDDGYSRTYSLEVNGDRAGVVFGIAHQGRYHYLLIGCDYEKFGKFSPGLIMYDEIMRDWVDQGGEIFDFTIGDEPFKSKFAAKPTAMYQILHANSLIGRLAKYVYEAKF